MSRAVPEIPGHMAPPHVATALQHQVSRLLGRRSTAFPGSQPVSFARKHIENNLFKEDYFVCEKSDGIRCLMYLASENGEEAVYLITRNNEYYLIPQLHFPTERGPSTFHEGGLIDGELVISRSKDGSEKLKYLMFDCLALEGKLLTNRSLDKRLGHLRTFLYKPYEHLWHEFPEDCKLFPFRAEFKQMSRASYLTQVFEEILPRLGHVSDGLIFTPRYTPYVFGTDEKLLKWKPPEENTVDFKLQLEFPTFTDPDLPPETATYPVYDDKPVFHLLVWHGGTKHAEFSTMYVTDEEWEKLKGLNEPLNGRIVEAFKDDDHQWRYMRFRDDKETGNHISTVEKVIESIEDSVSKEELIKSHKMIWEYWKQREKAGHQGSGSIDRRQSHSEESHGGHKRPLSMVQGNGEKRLKSDED